MNSTNPIRFSSSKIFIHFVWIVIFLSLLLAYVPLAQGEEPFFSIALSKFNNEQDAVKEEARLKNSGHNAFYRKEKSPDDKSIAYQIYIEKYNSRDEAEKEARVLKDLELISEYTVSEVREAPQTNPEEKIPDEEKANEELLATQAPEAKELAPELPPETEKQTIAPEPDSKTEELTATPESPPVINKTETESPLLANKEKQETEEIAKPQNKDEEPEHVINHDDQLTGAPLQVGAFSDEATAAELKKKLRNLGKNAFYRLESAGTKGNFFRLYITGYSSLHEAIKDAKILVESGIISDYSRIHSKEPFSTVPPEKKGEEGKGDNSYFIHISSNKDEANAVENVTRLKEYGYKAFYALEKDSSGTWYRVYIGGFKDEAEARKKGMELLDSGLITYFKPIVIDRKKLNN